MVAVLSIHIHYFPNWVHIREFAYFSFRLEMVYIPVTPTTVGEATRVALFGRDSTSSESASMSAVASTGGPWNGWFWGGGNGDTWAWAKWILFVLFVVFALAVVFGTSIVNKKRHSMGQAPIRGTAWMMPPSYRQSEREYVGNSQRYVEDYVPEYTEEANENDLGYYDERGEFHPNGKAEYIPPPPLEGMDYSSGASGSDGASASELERPERARVRDYTQYAPSDYGQDFTRPTFISDIGEPTFPGYYSNVGSPIAGAPPTSPPIRAAGSNADANANTVEGTRAATTTADDASSPASTDGSIERQEVVVEKHK